MKIKIFKMVAIMLGTVCVLTLAACDATPPVTTEHQHTFSDEWKSDETHHWHEATCEHTDEVGDYGEHTWDEGIVELEPLCTEDGIIVYTCTTCDYIKYELIEAPGHTFSDQWTSDETHHWHAATCEHTDEVSEMEEHIWVEVDERLEPTCTEDGFETYVCATCGHTKKEPIEKTGHTFTEEWTYDENYHWHEAICGHDVVSDYGEHFYHEGKCRFCGALQPVTTTEEGLVFNLIEDGTAYEVGQSRFTGANLNIPSTHNGLPVTRIGYGAFYTGYNLYSVVIPDSVTSIGGNAFYSCKNLASLTLGNGVTTIEYGAFFNCYRLTSLTIPASLTTIGKWGFLDCLSLVEIINKSELPLVEGSEDYGYLARHALHIYEEGGQSRLSYTDDRYTFYHDDNVSYLQGYWGKDTDLVLPSSFVAYDGTLIDKYEIRDYIFYDSERLTGLVIPDSVTAIGKATFRYCRKLMNVTIGNGVTTIGELAFNECQEMTHLSLGSSVTSIGTEAFKVCIKLIEVHNNSSLELTTGSTDHGHIGCYAKHIYTEGESFINTDEDGYRFFYNGTEAYLIDYVGLEGDLMLPSSFVAYDGTIVNQYIIYQYSFYYLTYLTRVNIPSSVATIEYRAFWNCIWVTNVIISNSVTFFNYGAFGGTGIKNVYYGGTPEEWSAIKFGNDTYELTDAAIYYYSETEPTKTGNYWHYAEDGRNPVVWGSEE